MNRLTSDSPHVTLDHVGIVGTDMGAMSGAFQRLGFAPTVPGALMTVDPVTGTPVSLDQQSCHMMFDEGYVELSTVDTQDPHHHLAAYARRHQGLQILAFGVENIEVLAARLHSAKVPITEPSIATRQVSYGRRSGAAKFRWFMLTPEAAPEALICFVQHLTPDIVFQAEVQAHPNNVVALAGVTIAVENPPRTAAFLSQITGGVAANAGQGWRVDLGRGSVTLCDHEQVSDRFPGAHFPSIPHAAAVSVKTLKLAAVVNACEDSGVPICVTSSRAWIEPQLASGAVIEFLE